MFSEYKSCISLVNFILSDVIVNKIVFLIPSHFVHCQYTEIQLIFLHMYPATSLTLIYFV